MIFADFRVVAFAALSCASLAWPVSAGQPKLDKDTCVQLHAEQSTFVQSGILADLQRGPEWGKSNLSADRMREIEHYIMLDEQIKFACREATLTPEMQRASDVAKRLELNPDADPFVPIPEPGADAAPDAPSGLSPAPDAKPKVRKQKPAAAKTGDEKTAADAKANAKADDALKVAPVYVAPPPVVTPAPAFKTVPKTGQ